MSEPLTGGRGPIEGSSASGLPDGLLLSADQLARRGVAGWQHVGGPDARLARVRRGSYAVRAEWDGCGAAARYRALVTSTMRGLRRPDAVASHWAAAALWDLPVLGAWPSVVDVVVAAGAPCGSHVVRRHRVRQVPQPYARYGVAVTSPARTVVDLARCSQLGAALVVADAALAGGWCSPEELDGEVDAIEAGGRGRRLAEQAVRLADGRAESPGESLSRAQMYSWGCAQPDLQVPLGDDRGTFGYADFGWDGVVGEFDGRIKYDQDDALWREKQREDRIRRTGVAVARWVWGDAVDGAAMARILRDSGVPASTDPWMRWDAARNPPRRTRLTE